jgi:hypothetical protein
MKDEHTHAFSPNPPRTTADAVGEATGGLAGMAAGAAVGSLGGPLGAIIGALAGTVGGWWAGREVAEAVEHRAPERDVEFREHHVNEAVEADMPYSLVQPGYHLGYVAAWNPTYRARGFAVSEPELAQGWTEELAEEYGPWSAQLGRVQVGFERGSQAAEAAAERRDETLRGDPATRAANRAHDRVADEHERGPR